MMYGMEVFQIESGKKTLDDLQKEYIFSDELLKEFQSIKALTPVEMSIKYPEYGKDNSINSNSIYYRGGD